MEEVLALLEVNPRQAIDKMVSKTKDRTRIESIREEYYDIKRNQRVGQLDRVQKGKFVGKGNRKDWQEAVKIPVPFQNKIVTTATAFEVGEPVTLVPYITASQVKENKITEEIKRLWKVNRIDNLIQKAVRLKKSELQCAILFYVKDIEQQSLINRLMGINNKKDVKTDLLQNKDGVMTPVYDAFGDMIAFVWQFATEKESKTYNHTWVYTDTYLYKFSNDNGNGIFQRDEKKAHGFSKIPIVYFDQENPEWHIAEGMIDRFEVAISKLGASNDYSGHPILKLYGEVLGAPTKDEDGKALRFNIKEDDDTGKVKHGDAEFLTHDNAPQSVKLELERLEKFIYSLTSTPDLSLENLKGIGDISGKAIRLMFMDAIIKSKMNEGENRTAIERIISVFVSGIVTTIGTNLKREAEQTYFDIKFNSILPNDLNDDVLTYVQAVGAKILSRREAVKTMGIADDVDKEMNLIDKETDEEIARIPTKEPANNLTNMNNNLNQSK